MYSLAEIWNSSIVQDPELANLLEAFTNVQARTGFLPAFSHTYQAGSSTQ
jgi:hypothetical protein